MQDSLSQESISKLSPLAFTMLGAISLVIWWRPLASNFALALSDQQYTHILLIVPVSVTLIILDWKAPPPSSRLSVSIGSLLLVSAAALAFIVRWKVIALPADVQLSGSMLAFVLWWIGAFILCFGTRAFRNTRFPLLFLLWLVPFPAFLLDPIVGLLQRGSAASAHWLFAAVRVPVEQHGMLLHIPDLTLEVAPECSSIRSSLILLVTTMVVAQLLLRSTWRKAVVVAVAIPLSVAKNGLRIFVIAMLATRVDPGFLTGRLHRQGGVIFLLIALAVIFLFVWIFRRGEEERPTERVVAQQSNHRG
ncbi:MAG: exosortase/archaeosortase family protein [Candidatus Sulfotelmatobacter sp.]